MDSELYDEFGNYVGPDLESDEDEQLEEQPMVRVYIILHDVGLAELLEPLLSIDCSGFVSWQLRRRGN